MADTHSIVKDLEIDNEGALSQESESEYNDNDCESDTGSFLSTASGPPTLRKKRMAASPLEEPNVKRFTPPSTPKTVKSKTKQKAALKGKNMSFSDMMLMSFADSSFITNVGPYFASMMQPIIEGAIETAVKTTVDTINSSVVDKVLQSNKDLQISNSKLQCMVEKQQVIIENRAKILDSHKNHIKSVERKVQDLTKEVSGLKLELSNLEQYGRRNSLRFSNMKVKQKDFTTENDFKRPMVSFINSKVLKVTEEEPALGISVSDLDRCHAVGMYESPQVLVKFHKYETKRRVYSAKKNLKHNAGRVFVTEDLTRLNQSLIKTLIPLKKAGAITSFWTINGSIFIKKLESENSVRIQSIEDISRLVLL